MNPQAMTQDIRYVRSDRDPSRFYLVALNRRGFWECECPAARFNRAQPCKHTRRVAKEGAGLVAQPTRCDQPKNWTAVRPVPAAPRPQPSPAVRDLVSALEL